MVRVGLHLGIPQAEHAIAALCKIGVLRSVKLRASRLPRIWIGEERRIRVPVIAIELHDKVRVRHEGVNAELARDRVLREKDDPQLTEQAIAATLIRVGVSCLLVGRHLDQTRGNIGAGIAASLGAILTRDGRRPEARLPACLAQVWHLRAARPFVSVLLRAKPMLSETCRREIDRSGADSTRPRFAMTPVRREARSRAETRISLPIPRSAKELAALQTGSSFVRGGKLAREPAKGGDLLGKGSVELDAAARAKRRCAVSFSLLPAFRLDNKDHAAIVAKEQDGAP